MTVKMNALPWCISQQVYRLGHQGEQKNKRCMQFESSPMWFRQSCVSVDKIEPAERREII